jgi:cytochrome d ubiquinol oxidase subunit II
MELSLETMQLLWYVVYLFSMFAYAALDGFDIGVGCLHLFARSDLQRRIFINAIGPVWDGNSLWVVIVSGTLLAGFPKAFATLFSSLYIPMLFLVFGYIVRGAAIEFRGKIESTAWKSLWDTIFAVASYSLAFGFGVVLANMIGGIQIDEKGALVGGTLSLFQPYAILLGLFTTSLFMLHGALYLNMKCEGELQKRVQNILQNVLMCFVFLWGLVTILTLIFQPHMTAIFTSCPPLLAIVFMALIGIALIPKLLSKGYEGLPFLSSFLIILSLVLTYALGTYPHMIRLNDTKDSITIYNASSSPITMKVLLIIACAGVPLFLLYLFYSYKVFKGKVKLDSMSY